MGQEFNFQISKKDFGRILRRQRKWYLFGMIVLLVLLIADGIVLGVRAQEKVEWWLIAFIPILALGCGTLWFFGFTDGGSRIYGDCKALFREDGTLAVSCKRESELSLPDRMGFEKTMKIRKVAKKGNYWIIYGEHRKWVAIPTEIPIPSSLSTKAKR